MSDRFDYYEIPDIPPSPWWHRYWNICSQQVGAQLSQQSGSLFPWSPVLFGVGCLGTFFVGSSVSSIAIGACCFALFYLCLNFYNQKAFLIFVSCLLVAAGAGDALYRINGNETQFLQHSVQNQAITARLFRVDPTAKGYRLWLDHVETVSGTLPSKIRVSVRGRQRKLPEIGTYFSTSVSLFPPTGRILPDGYDYKTYLFFQGIGATGYVTAQLSPFKQKESFNLQQSFYSLQKTVIKKLEQGIEAPYDGVAIAMLTGQRMLLEADYYASYRRVGLAHLIAISGLHIGILAGFLYFMLRYGLCLYPPLGTYIPIYKIAAFCTIPLVWGFVFFVGAPVSAVRAALMCSLVMVCVMRNREVLSYRLVALAALLILILRPEEILSIGFQLSFLAVLTLVSLYDIIRHQDRDTEKKRWGKRLFSYIFMIFLSSLCISFVTAPTLLYSFHEMSFVSPLSNIVALPVLGFIIMPSAIFFCLFGLLGQGEWFLKILQFGLQIINEGVVWLDSFPIIVFSVERFSTVSFLCFTIGMLWILLWRSWFRLVGAVPFFLLGGFAWNSQTTGILLSGESVYYVENDAVYPIRKTGSYAETLWEKQFLLLEDEVGYPSCSEGICTTAMGDAFALTEMAEHKLCQGSQKILIAVFQLCPEKALYQQNEDVKKGAVFLETAPVVKWHDLQGDYLNIVYKERLISLEP